jgi:hypothetical protein
MRFHLRSFAYFSRDLYSLKCMPKFRAYIHTAGGFGLRWFSSAAFWVRDGKTK